jgi:hypothetical protein
MTCDMRHTARLLLLALVASILGVVAAEASPATHTCIAESCRPAGRECARAFRATKPAALSACQETIAGGSRRQCRGQVRRAIRDGVQSCRESRHDCNACCREGGGACPVGVCGNALREGGEACDGADTGSCAGGCRADCTCVPIVPVPVCGNDDVEGNEQCDGTDDSACPGRCRADCTCEPEPPLVCGDGVVGENEECDGSDDAACPGRCRTDCTCQPENPPVCGDGVLDDGEECDVDFDAACPGLCDFDCTCLPPPVCGNDMVERGEQCEPNVSDFTCDGRCLPDCTCAVCGNAVIEAPFEVCESTDDAACPGLCSPWSCACLSPTTDSCEAPHEIATLPAFDRQTSEPATTAPGDPILTCAAGTPRPHQRSIWYAVTAPATGRIRADPAASTYDTVLAAYSGSCDALIPLACSDDLPATLRAPIDFPVSAGEHYLLEAAAYEGESSGELAVTFDFVPCGDGTLDAGEDCEPSLAGTCAEGTCSPQCECLTIPADECADAAVATVLPIDVGLAAYQGTSNASDPPISCKSSMPVAAPSTWFRFRAPADGSVEISTRGSLYDTVVGVFVGECNALDPVACNDDYFDYTSFLTVDVTAGVDYTVLVVPWFNEPARRLDLSIAYTDPQ